MPTGQEYDKNKPRRTETRRLISREGDTEIWEISITESVSEPDPFDTSAPDWPAHFGHIKDWLSYLCNAFQPAERVVAYFFSIHQFSDGYSVLFTGNRKFDPGDKEWPFYVDDEMQSSRILSDTEYKGLSREEVLKKFTAELKAFSETEQFKQSFFAKAKALATGFYKEEIVMIK